MMAAAIATALAAGGALLWYVRAEFLTGRRDPQWPADACLGPVLGGLAVINGRPISIMPWVIVGAALVATAGVAIARRVIAIRAKKTMP